jgi:hypothetical protein
MLELIVGGSEMYDDPSQEFTTQGGVRLQLEHSLLSLSKWESITEKPFLGKGGKTVEEVFLYVKCMAIDPEIPPEIFQQLDSHHYRIINEYIERRMTATWFADAPGAPQTRDVITSELIYYWMTVFNIPFSCEKWNLNRLFTLIRVCNIKQSKPKKMSRTEIAQRNRELNARRKAELGTKG